MRGAGGEGKERSRLHCSYEVDIVTDVMEPSHDFSGPGSFEVRKENGKRPRGQLPATVRQNLSSRRSKAPAKPKKLIAVYYYFLLTV